MNLPPGKPHAALQREVAEFQGLYGAFTVSEVLLQKVWLRGEFDLSRARTQSGETVGIFHTGSWNRMAGPDFRGAKLKLGDRMVIGDIEVHFHAEAWMQHGHDSDPAYEDVVLHVVLFPPRADAPPARTRAGREIPVLVLVDLLWHDLEEYASDEAVAALSGRDPFPLLEELLAEPEEVRLARLRDAAGRRWRQKVHFAGLRLKRLGWEQACHLTTLEILGYRSNRVAMMRVGERFPWLAWKRAAPTLDDVIAVAADWWTLRGVRPANQPRLRLSQYVAWMQHMPDWPARLRAWALPELPADADPEGVVTLRRKIAMPGLRELWAQDLCAGHLGGTRLDTWITNLALPLLASAEPAHSSVAERLWHTWYPGDAPAAVLKAIRHLGSGGTSAVRCNGLVQGLLGLHLARQLPVAAAVGDRPLPGA